MDLANMRSLGVTGSTPIARAVIGFDRHVPIGNAVRWLTSFAKVSTMFWPSTVPNRRSDKASRRLPSLGKEDRHDFWEAAPVALTV
jgi:hypothetical protein